MAMRKAMHANILQTTIILSLFWLKVSILSYSSLILAQSVTPTVHNNVTTNSSSSNNTHKPIQVDPLSIGYDGPWDRFCNETEMEKDFINYPKHELKKLRIIICDLIKENKMNTKALPALAVFKYCLVMRPRVDEFLLELTMKFSQDDTGKRELLLSQAPENSNTICFEKCIFKFSKICIEEKNPYFEMFKALIARACEMFWLTAEDIKEQMEKVCLNRLITEKIDWDQILETINYKVES